MVSGPPRPRMHSFEAVPMSVSCAFVPRMTRVPLGQQLGSSPRLAVTACVFVVVRPAVSVAVHVTMVFPSGNVEGASFVIVGVPPQASVPVAVPMLGVLHDVIVLAGGTVRVGGVVPLTVTLCVAVAVLSSASLAVQVTTVVPSGN